MRGDRKRQSDDKKGFSNKRADALADDLDILLHDLCVQWGFCNYLSGYELASAEPALTADAFATAILVAEGFPEPELELEWTRRFKRLFIDRYGLEVSASDYLCSKPF